MRTHCEHFEPLASLLRSQALDVDRAHEVSSEHDLAAFIESGVGIAFAPRSAFTRRPSCVPRCMALILSGPYSSTALPAASARPSPT